MKLTLIISSNDSETIWNAFRFANTSLAYDNEVNIFLLGKGVEAPLVSTLKHDIGEQMDIFRESGGKLSGCGICCENRRNEIPSLLDALQCEMGSMQQLHELVANSDRTLTF
jgi:sulfur relay (sulfurtransferase) complex TusBCD TusD component (DsrE family)